MSLTEKIAAGVLIGVLVFAFFGTFGLTAIEIFYDPPGDHHNFGELAGMMGVFTVIWCMFTVYVFDEVL